MKIKNRNEQRFHEFIKLFPGLALTFNTTSMLDLQIKGLCNFERLKTVC